AIRQISLACLSVQSEHASARQITYLQERKRMRKLLKLVPDVPVQIALGCAEGVNVVSPRGTPAVKYTLVDGRTFYATQYVNSKFKELGIGPNERIALCQRNIDGKTITEVTRIGSDPDPSPPDTDHPLPAENESEPELPEITN